MDQDKSEHTFQNYFGRPTTSNEGLRPGILFHHCFQINAEHSLQQLLGSATRMCRISKKKITISLNNRTELFHR